MKNKKNDLKDFELFTSSNVSISNSDFLQITKNFQKDLVTSPFKLAIAYIIGSFLGYLGTLAICAQSSIGLSPLAWMTASYLHKIPDPWCAILCGAVFGIAPFAINLIVFNRFKHRYLIFKMWWLVILIPITASLTMSLVGNFRDLTWTIQWIITAVAAPYICSFLSGLLLRQEEWRSRDR